MVNTSINRRAGIENVNNSQKTHNNFYRARENRKKNWFYFLFKSYNHPLQNQLQTTKHIPNSGSRAKSEETKPRETAVWVNWDVDEETTKSRWSNCHDDHEMVLCFYFHIQFCLFTIKSIDLRLWQPPLPGMQRPGTSLTF